MRVLSHEINNSIAPIASIGETLKTMVDKQYSGSDLDNDLEEVLGVITERAQSLNIFIQRYQRLEKLPLPTKTLVNIRPLVQSVALLFNNVSIEIEILDHGTGINNMDNLFVPFYTTKKQGTGIGLSLSRQILVTHGGDLVIKNCPEHIGVRVTLFIPT